MNKDLINSIASLMTVDSPTISKGYLACIAREALVGIDANDLDNQDSEAELVHAARKSIGSYFCTWGDDLIKDLAVSFVRAYKSV